jgi:leucyl-tRNA synthetase
VDKLPLRLPEVGDFSPATTGEPPLARVKDWTFEGWPLETSTMPGFAGSSAYYLRYMDPRNDAALVSKEADDYWRSVDLYVGGIEHATGHLVYSRFWNKFLFDLGYVVDGEPFKKLVNQGMIQGRSNFVYRDKASGKFISHGLISGYDVQDIHVDVNIVRNDVLDVDAFRAWRPEFADAEFVLENGRYVCGWAIEKMSKSMYNVVNPDQIVADYGADTLRMYEMFLGPLEQSKPWDTNGIDGVHKFLRRFWNLFWENGRNNGEGDGRNTADGGEFRVTDDEPTAAEWKTLHKTIKKVTEDIENFSFNTSVAAFMICLNELGGCSKRAILEPLTILLAPFAPHITEEVWSRMGHGETIFDATMPRFDPKYLEESEFEYPVSVNGKLRFKKRLPLGISAAEIEKAVLEDENAVRWLEGGAPKKMIVVPGKIVNIVI